jgi:trans-aconitate 2-methyltransferase
MRRSLLVRDIWNASQYLKNQRSRDRPFFDLIEQINFSDNVKSVVDLGCGTGHLTAALAKRLPQAHVEGGLNFDFFFFCFLY